MVESEFRALTAEEVLRAAEQEKYRSSFEKAAYRLLPKSMKDDVEKNPPVPFGRHKAFFPDLFFPDDKILIEIDGKDHMKKQRQDSHRDNVFETNGYITIRIFTRQVRSKITFWTLLLINLKNINKVRKSLRINQYIDDLNYLIENEMLGWTKLDENFDEAWFAANHDQVDYCPSLFFNVYPCF